jgi:hypothetical protein
VRRFATLSLTVLAATASGCTDYGRSDPAMTTAAASERRSCFYAPHARGFQQGPGDSIIVNENSRDYFVLQPYHKCGNLNVRLGVGIRPRGNNYVCEGYDVDLYVPGPLGPEYCPVRAIRKLTPAEVIELRSSRGR